MTDTSKAILLIAHGSSDLTADNSCTDLFFAELPSHFPQYPVYQAYSAPITLRKIDRTAARPPVHTISEGGTAPGYADSAFQLKYKDKDTRETVEAMSMLKQYSVIPYPPVTLDAASEKRVAEIQDGLSRYAEQAMARFVTGDVQLTDENWDLFCRTVEEKGLQELIDIWQKAIQ